MSIVTKSYIENFCETKSPEQVAQFIGRALVVIFNNQTQDEKRVNTTNQDNGIGFTGADAHSGCITAKTFLKRKTLLDWQVERWTKRNKNGTMRIAKYWKQLNEAAEAKVRAKSPAKPVVKPVEVEREIDWANLDTAAIDIQMKNDFAKYEMEQEQKAFASKYEGLPQTIAWRRMIRDNADPRSL